MAAVIGTLEDVRPRLLCASTSLYWSHHLRDFVARILGAALPSTAGGDFWEVDVPKGRFPAQQIEVLRLSDSTDDASIHTALANADATALFVQGHHPEHYQLLLESLAAKTTARGTPPRLLVLAGLVSDEDLEAVELDCLRLGIAVTVQALSSMKDDQSLAHLSGFLLGLQDGESTSLGSSPIDKSINSPSIEEREQLMAAINESLADLLKIDGAMAVALVDSSTGLVLGKGGGGLNLDAAAAGNTEVVRAKLKTMKALGLNDLIEDILITLGKQFHIIRPMMKKPGVFIYLVLDKDKGNLGMARYKVGEIEGTLTF